MGTTLGQRLVVIWLVLSGSSALFYADFLSLPPVSEQAVPPVWWVVGAMTLAAAMGVLRRAAWGRPLAIVVAAFTAVWAVWGQAYGMRADLSAWLRDWRWLSTSITVALAGLALWWLLRRWPPSPRQAA